MKKYFISLIIISTIFGCDTAVTTDENTRTSNADSLASLNVSTFEVSPELVEFPSLDGLPISAVIFEVDPDAETILLCHQAGFNMHEYDEIMPKLNAMGFNCIAIDQRSGGILNGIVNQTADRAITESLPVKYVNSEQDIIAGIDFINARYLKKTILWGSSYSSALALHIGVDNEKLNAVISFSPGDYFEQEKPLLKEIMPSFNLPFFITSSKSESTAISDFLGNKVLDKNHVHFIPSGNGIHGSKALWQEQNDTKEYWEAITTFLNQF